MTTEPLTFESRQKIAAREALKFANRVRVDNGLPPLTALLPGKRMLFCDCPIARTISYGMADMAAGAGAVGAELYQAGADFMEDEPIDTWLSDSWVDLFILKFDRGEYPELVA